MKCVCDEEIDLGARAQCVARNGELNTDTAVGANSAAATQKRQTHLDFARERLLPALKLGAVHLTAT